MSKFPTIEAGRLPRYPPPLANPFPSGRDCPEGPKDTKTCYRCGRPGHISRNAPSPLAAAAAVVVVVAASPVRSATR